MKKTIISMMLVGSLVASPVARADFFHLTNSEVSSIVSVVIVLSPFLSSAALSNVLEKASTSKKPITVKNVEHIKDNKTKVTGNVEGDKPVDFIMDTNKAKKANLKVNDDIYVQEAKLGYVLQANKTALGIVPNEANMKDFQQTKVN